jgi:hypothetical protein
MKILKMYLKVKFCEATKMKQFTHTLQASLTTRVNYQNQGKIFENSLHCVSNAVEIWLLIPKNQSLIAHNM